MTSKLKCPFCQQELLREYNRDRDTVVYRCDNCYFQGDGIIWQALIQAKQDLKIATKALEDIASGQIIEHSVVGHEWDNTIAIARKALEQIEHKE